MQSSVSLFESRSVAGTVDPRPIPLRQQIACTLRRNTISDHLRRWTRDKPMEML